MNQAANTLSPWLLACFIALCCFLSLCSPPTQAAQLIQLNGAVEEIELDQHLDYQTYHSDSLSAETEKSLQSLKPVIKQLQPLWDNTLHIPSNHNNALIRFAIHNQEENNRVFWLSIHASKPFESSLIETKDIRETTSNLILMERYAPNNGLYQYQTIYQIQLKPEQYSSYYLNLKTLGDTRLDVHLKDPMYNLSSLSRNALWINSCLGALSLLAMINLLSAVFVRSPWLSLHTAYLVFLSLAQVIQQGYFNVWWPAGSPIYFLVLSTCALLANLSLNWLGCTLSIGLGPQKIWKRLNQLAVILTLLSATSAFIWPQHGMAAQTSSLFFSMLVFSLLCFFLYQNDQDSNALLMSVTRLIALISLLLCWLAFKLDITSHHTFLMISLIFLIDNFIISLALHYRCFKRIKRRWQRQQNELLQVSQEQTQKDVLSRFSHDIRTPISGVTGMAELLADTSLSNTQTEYVETIQSSATLILSMINEVLDSSLLDHNLNVKFAPFELHVMIEDTLQNYQSRAEHEGIELITHIHSELPELINGDMTRIRQILSHLLSHAFSHTAKGEVLLSVKPLSQTDEEQLVLFSVKDTSPGLSREQQRKLLTESGNHQTNNNTASFTLVKRLVEEMQGELGINSAPHKGCEVWFSLPMSSHSLNDHTDLDIDQALRHKRLLIVDDNATFTKLIRQQCQSWGMQAQEANSGSAALALLHAKHTIDEAFDLVVVDHQMPNMSGLQLAGKIADDTQLTEKPILLMLTGLSKAPFSDTAKDYGIRRILTKPVSGRVLKTTLAEEVIHAQSLQLLNNTEKEPNKSLEVNTALHILVAEDNTVNQQIVQAMLKKLGHTMELVNNGEEAVALFCEQDFDLVLMDYEMPILDGLEATRAIRSWERHYQKTATPIIAMTGHIMPTDITTCHEAGMNQHLAKPLTLQKLKLCLETSIDNISAHQQSH